MSHYPKYINSMSDPVTITGNIWIYPTSSHLFYTYTLPEHYYWTILLQKSVVMLKNDIAEWIWEN